MPLVRPVRCRYCGGNLYLEPVIPGLLDLKCLLCSRAEGEILAEDLGDGWKIPAEAVKRAEQNPLSFVWSDDMAVS